MDEKSFSKITHLKGLPSVKRPLSSGLKTRAQAILIVNIPWALDHRTEGYQTRVGG